MDKRVNLGGWLWGLFHGKWATCVASGAEGLLQLYQSMKRFTRLTNGFSRKFEYHQAAVGLHFALYNDVTVHGTLRTTPAVAAGVAQKPWTVAELIERPATTAAPRFSGRFDSIRDGE